MTLLILSVNAIGIDVLALSSNKITFEIKGMLRILPILFLQSLFFLRYSCEGKSTCFFG